jgi:hypothetical protein
MPRLFNGAIHFIQVDFGGVKLSDADTSAAYQYSVLASPVLKAYCMQYGACSVNVDNRIYPFTWPSRTYSDSDLQNWVATLTSKFNFPSQDCLVFLSPPGATNTDAPYSSGILGYHNATGTHQPYIFVNVMGTGLVINDQADLFADALSHEIAEMIVDPLADLSNPETNDSCSGNCGTDNRNYFDAQGKWIGGGGAPGVGSPSTWSFYTNGVAAPYAVTSCPAPAEACRYDPNTPPSSPPPAPGPEGCIQQVKNGLANLEQGNLASGVLEILQGIECLFGSGFITESGQPSLDGRRVRLQLHKKPF